MEADRETLWKEESVKLRVKRIHDAVPVPAYATEGAAGLDLCTAAPCIIQPGQIVRVPTGVCVEIPPGYEGQVRPRSGLASQGVVAILGTIDSDYRGEIHVLLENRGLEPFAIEPCMRIAQLVIAPVARVEVEVVDVLSETERGAQGFGSTGVWAMAPRTEAAEGGGCEAEEIADCAAVQSVGLPLPDGREGVEG